MVQCWSNDCQTKRPSCKIERENEEIVLLCSSPVLVSLLLLLLLMFSKDMMSMQNLFVLFFLAQYSSSNNLSFAFSLYSEEIEVILRGGVSQWKRERAEGDERVQRKRV